MGDQRVQGGLEGAPRRAFVRRLLNDLHALEFMLENDLIESGVRRIGAEQEVFLVDRSWRPAPAALEAAPLASVSQKLRKTCPWRGVGSVALYVLFPTSPPPPLVTFPVA